jgi:hypothetical protein
MPFHNRVLVANPKALLSARAISLFSVSLRLISKLGRSEQLSGPRPIAVIGRNASSVPLGGVNCTSGNVAHSICAREASLATTPPLFIGHLHIGLQVKAL